MRQILSIADNKIGDNHFSMIFSVGNYNRYDKPAGVEPFEIVQVLLPGEFKHGIPSDLEKWLKSSVPEWSSPNAYSAIVVDCPYQSMIPAIRRAHPHTPLLVTSAMKDEQHTQERDTVPNLTEQMYYLLHNLDEPVASETFK
jgi:hypothetical protein